MLAAVIESGGNELLHIRLRGSEIKSTFLTEDGRQGPAASGDGEWGCQVLMPLPTQPWLTTKPRQTRIQK